MFDNTLFGSGKDGLMFVGEHLIYRSAFADPIPVPYEAIAAVKYSQLHVGKNLDKLEDTLVISKKDDSQLVIKDLTDCNYAALASVLQGID